MKKRKYWLPAIFSALIIGLGQIIKGHSKKGLKWILLFYFLYPAAIYASLAISARLFIAVLGVAVVVYPVFWLYNVADALTKPVHESKR